MALAGVKMKSVYLAGFDVFRPDARQWGATLKDLCSTYGFLGLYPLDNEAPRSLSGSELALWIYRANISLIQQADLVAARSEERRLGKEGLSVGRLLWKPNHNKKIKKNNI